MAIHEGFVSLESVCRKIVLGMNYATYDNFTGGPVPGYKSHKAYLAEAPAMALVNVQEKALLAGYSLKIFDSYRPVKAVEYFQEWAKLPETNPLLKARFYPKFTRLDLFQQGFIAKQSSHSRGCAVDLTLVDLSTGFEVDMGTEFDFFDELSHTDAPAISQEQKNNRMMLRDLMESEGFRNFFQEWWHFSFRPEPFPGQSFNFDIE